MVIMLITKCLNNLVARRLIDTIFLTKREKSLDGQPWYSAPDPILFNIFMGKIKKTLVSSSPCKELGSHHSILTTCKNPESKISNPSWILREKSTGPTTASKTGETGNKYRKSLLTRAVIYELKCQWELMQGQENQN